MGIVYYMQTDPKWANVSYSAPGENTNIGKAGCGPTSAAMVIASWKDKSVTPLTTAAWSLKHGYKAKNQGTYYSYFAPQMKEYGIKCYQLNATNLYGNKTSGYHNSVEYQIQMGNLVIACMGKGNWTSSGHFVLLYNIKNGIAYVNDPNSTKTSRTQNTWDLFKSQVKYYFVCEKPNDSEGDDDVTEERVREIVQEILAGNGSTAPDWAKKEWQEAADKKIIANMDRPEGYAKRDEVAAMIVRAINK